ncbi:MAG: AAA family ATPase, partial [Planctomycetota bacterium]
YCNHGNGLLAPVVDSSEVPVADRNHIPRPDLDGVLAEALSRNLRLLLVGDAGCGKSSGVVQFAARLGWPLRRVNLNGETGVSEFVGQWVVRGQDMHYQEGVLPQALRRGEILLLDEIDAAQPEVLFVLQAVLEGEALFLADTNSRIAPHPDFRVIATANSIGDDSGLYAGAKTPNAATLDRWDIVHRVGYPDAQAEAAMIARRSGINPATAQAVVGFFADLREAATRGDLTGPFSTRRALAFAGLLHRHCDPTLALRLALTDRLISDERSIVGEIAQRHFAQDPKDA